MIFGFQFPFPIKCLLGKLEPNFWNSFRAKVLSRETKTDSVFLLNNFPFCISLMESLLAQHRYDNSINNKALDCDCYYFVVDVVDVVDNCDVDVVIDLLVSRCR